MTRWVKPGEVVPVEPEPEPRKYRPIDRVLMLYGWHLTEEWRDSRRYNQPRQEGHVIRIEVGTYTVDATPSVHPSWGKGSADVEEGPSLLWSHDVVDEHHQHLARLAGGLILRMDGQVQGGDEDERFTVTAADDFPGMVQQAADEIAHHLDHFHRGRKSWRGWLRSLVPW
jgi:hypothetical protein